MTVIGVNGVLFADRADRLWRLGVYLGFLRASQTANVAGGAWGFSVRTLLRLLLLIYFDPKSSRSAQDVRFRNRDTGGTA